MKKNKITLEEYFNNNEHGINVFKKKYMNEDTDKYVDDVFRRIINEVSSVSCEKNNKNINEYKDKWLKSLLEGKWRAGGSILAALNKPKKKISVYNCSGFVIREDSLESIFTTRYQAAKAAAYRQGFGVLFDVIRPKDTKINNSAEVSEGVVHWMKSFDRIGIECGQKSRFPAQLFALNIKHPDILDFIRSKTDLNAIQNANISVMITDDFFDVLDANGDWELRFDFPNGEQESVVKNVKAKELYDLIIKTMRDTAEPGVLFIDHLRNWSIQEALGYKIEITNAPLIADTLIATDKGIYTIEELYNLYKDNKLDCKVYIDRLFNNFILNIHTDTNYHSFEVEKYDNQDRIDIVLENNMILSCNPEHMWFTSIGGLTKTKDLRCNDKLIIPFSNIWSSGKDVVSVDNEDFIDGYIYCIFNSNVVLDKISKKSILYTYIKKYCDNHDILYYEDDFGFYLKEDIMCFHNKIYTNRMFCAGYLTCLFENNVFFVNKGLDYRDFQINIDVSNISHDISFIQKMLMFFGVISYYDETNKVLNIRDYISCNLFINNIKVTFDKNDIEYIVNKLSKEVIKADFRTLKIKEIINTNIKEDMYCIKIPNVNGFTANGILSSNCGEKPIPDKGVCCLASINMAKVPHIKRQVDGHISDTKELHKFLDELAKELVRFMDDVVQYEIDNDYKSPLREQLEVVKDLREIGIGITNLHKWFFDQGVEYASSEATVMAEIFFKYLQYYTFKYSCLLAKERGPCRAYEKAKKESLIKETPFLRHLFEEFPDLKELFYRYGIRNASLLSIAPTGSISHTFSTPTLSTGIEPAIFSCGWKRTRFNTEKYDEWEFYFIIYDDVKNEVLKKMEEMGLVDTDDYKFMKELPTSVLDNDGKIGLRAREIVNKYLDSNLIKPSQQINPFNRIDMMSAIQKWVDASISNTFNLSKKTTYNELAEIVRYAYDKKLKSMTVYVEGTREEIYTTLDPKSFMEQYKRDINKKDVVCNKRPETIIYHCAPKRPEVLPCDIHHCIVNGKPWIVFIGLMDNKPYEIFAGEYDSEIMHVPKKLKIGTIRKIKKSKKQPSKYNLEIKIRNSKVVYEDISNLFMNKEYKALTRLISLPLRHGVYPRFIIEQLKKSSDYVVDFMSVTARVLSKYKIDEYDRFIGNEISCPLCGSPMVNEGGCMKCSNNECGYSKCD